MWRFFGLCKYNEYVWRTSLQQIRGYIITVNKWINTCSRRVFCTLRAPLLLHLKISIKYVHTLHAYNIQYVYIMYECAIIKVHIHINKFLLRWCNKRFCNLEVQQLLFIANCPKLLGFWQNQTAWRPKTNDFQIKMYINLLLLKRNMFQTQLVVFVHVSLKTQNALSLETASHFFMVSWFFHESNTNSTQDSWFSPKHPWPKP